MKPDEFPSNLLKSQQAAKFLQVSDRTLWGITSPRGPLKCVKIGKRNVRYRLSDLQEYVERECQSIDEKCNPTERTM